MATKSTRYSDAKIIDLWLQSQGSQHTQSCYRRDSARLLAHVRKPLARITLGDLHSFAQSLVEDGLAPISRARTISATKSLFGFCQRMRFVPANPAAELPLPRYEMRLPERILAEGDVDKMLSADAPPRDRGLLHLIYAAGVRVSEACQLRWRNLRPNAEAGQISVFGKNGRTRSIALPKPVWSELISLRGTAAAEDPVFPSRSGKALDRGRVRAIVRGVAAQAGVATTVSPHWLRHAHASHALDHGAPIHLVQATLGHSSVATTSRYLHARPGDSSARFLAPVGLSPTGATIALPSKRTGVMDIMTAVPTAKGEQIVTSNNEEQANTEAAAPAKEPKAARKAAVVPQARRVAPAKGKSEKTATLAKKAPKGAKAAKPATLSGGGREGSKTAKVLDLLKRPGGATAKELRKATGWLPHSVRGFLSGTVGKKMGLTVNSAKGEDGERSYSVNG